MPGGWTLSNNKVKFRQVCIKWMTSNGQLDVPVYLGGTNTDDITCITVWRGETIRVPSLKNDYEEAYDLIFYHLNHSIKYHSFQKILYLLLAQMFLFVLTTITKDGCIVA